MVSRLNPDGSLDTVFGGDGTAVADFGGTDYAVRGGAGNQTARSSSPVQPRAPAGHGDRALHIRGLARRELRPGGSRRRREEGVRLSRAGADLGDCGAARRQDRGRQLAQLNDNPDFAVTRLNARRLGGRQQLRGRRLRRRDSPTRWRCSRTARSSSPATTCIRARRPGWPSRATTVDGTLDETFGGTGKRPSGPATMSARRPCRCGQTARSSSPGSAATLRLRRRAAELRRHVRHHVRRRRDVRRPTSGSGVEAAYAAALQPDGRIVVAGGAVVSLVEADFAVARLQPGGALDTTFSSDGRTTVGFGGRELAYAVALQPDGRIVRRRHDRWPTTTSRSRVSRASPRRRRAEAGADRTAPILSRFSASPRRFRTRRASSAAAKRRAGAPS